MIRRLQFLHPKYVMRPRGPRAAPRKKRPTGVTLVELLVALLVLGVGVLGVTGLQILSLQTNRAALFHTEAVRFAHDMMGRIRAGAADRHTALAYGGLAIGDLPAAPPDCGRHDCDSAQMALFDQAVWKCSLGRFVNEAVCTGLARPATGLPEGDGSVDVDPSTGLILVTVRWRERDRQRTVSVESRV